jgi:hypothetical protein
VQTAAVSVDGGAAAVTFAEVVGSHHAIIVAFVAHSGSGLAPVTDTLGSTYLKALGPVMQPNTQLEHWIYYALDVKGGPDEVTISSSSAAQIELYIHEYAGFALAGALDRADGTSGTSLGTDGAGSPVVNTTAAPELLFGFVTARSVTVGTGFMARGTLDSNVKEDRIVDTPGPWRATATPDSDWTALVATFRGR